VNGVFHGSSAKASIFFVEPSETLEINNEITLLEEEEKREVTRILRLLTAFVAGYREVLRDFSTALYQIDFVNAKALYALDEEACLPQLVDKPHIELIKAINPVLRDFHKAKKKPVVPLDIRLDAQTRILVISGPNAGGKSITLKTVGLLQLMLQSGLLVTVHPDSTMGWFNGIMADIGDAQSIENELSTYSSKLNKMKYFLDAAYGKTLVLIDEFGSGSDPDLGSSMAQVFLRALNESKTYGVMTTHYNSIKHWPATCRA
jgi:DNA mismatch repair protein MutS2